MDLLGRYYSNDIVSQVLVNNLETVAPRKIIDLGVGNASLTIAAYNRWNNAQFYASEIEGKKVKAIRKNLTYVKVENHDCLKINLGAKLNIRLGSIDVAVCNPPYVKVEKTKKYKKLFEEVGMQACMALKQISSEVVFFAQNLTLLKRNGEMGIIVSDSLITGKDYKIFRETILSQFEVKTIIQLPDKIFAKTEARTHILVLNKTKPVNNDCVVKSADVNGVYRNTLSVSKERLIERMDFDFWAYALNRNETCKTLKDIGVQIKRGYYLYKDLRESELTYFHSNNFPSKPSLVRFSKKVAAKNKSKAANPGDILMCRVGKRCVGKLARVKKGSVIISNCVYRISVPKEYQKIVWQSLSSKQGSDWLKAYAHGVCAQVISKSDLENFPVCF